MQNPFKKQPTKEQRRESKRRWAIITGSIYPLLLANCKSVNEMKHRLECTLRAIQEDLTVKIETFKHKLEDESLGSWKVQPLKGEGTKLEQTLLDLLADEPIKVVDQILTHLPRIIDTFIYEEMGKREPNSLKATFPE